MLTVVAASHTLSQQHLKYCAIKKNVFWNDAPPLVWMLQLEMNKHMLLFVLCCWMCRWCAYVLPPYLLQLFTFSITTFLGKSWPLLFAFTFDAKSRGATARRCQKCGDRQTDFGWLWLNRNILLQNVWPINGLEINFSLLLFATVKNGLTCAGKFSAF